MTGQRLLRRICNNCKAPYQPTPAEIRVVAEQVGHQPKQWLKGTGCNLCNRTGYRGRVGVYELLAITDGMRELIVGRATHHEMRDRAVEEGMRTMQEQAFNLVVDGVTTVEMSGTFSLVSSTWRPFFSVILVTRRPRTASSLRAEFADDASISPLTASPLIVSAS